MTTCKLYTMVQCARMYNYQRLSGLITILVNAKDVGSRNTLVNICTNTTIHSNGYRYKDEGRREGSKRWREGEEGEEGEGGERRGREEKGGGGRIKEGEYIPCPTMPSDSFVGFNDFS